MFKFTYEWVISMAKNGLVSRGVPEEEADELLRYGDSWLDAEKLEAARAEMLKLINSCEASIIRTEQHFLLGGPVTNANINTMKAVVAELTAYVDAHLGGMPK